MINIFHSVIFFPIYVSFDHLIMYLFNGAKIYCKSIICKKTVPHQYEDTNHGSVIDVTFFFDRAVLRLLFSKSFDFSDLLSQTLVNDFSDLQILTTSLIFYFFICLSSILCSSPVPHSPLEVGLEVIIVIVADNSQKITSI